MVFSWKPPLQQVAKVLFIIMSLKMMLLKLHPLGASQWTFTQWASPILLGYFNYMNSASLFVVSYIFPIENIAILL